MKYLVQEKMVAIKRAKMELARIEQLVKVTASLDTELDDVEAQLAVAKFKFAATRRPTPSFPKVVPKKKQPATYRPQSDSMFTENSAHPETRTSRPSRPPPPPPSEHLPEIDSSAFDTTIRAPPVPDRALKASVLGTHKLSPFNVPIHPPKDWSSLEKSLISVSNEEEETEDFVDGIQRKLSQTQLSSPSSGEKQMVGAALAKEMDKSNPASSEELRNMIAKLGNSISPSKSF